MDARFGQYNCDGLQFTYHVSFKEIAGNISWRAIVRDHNGALVATPKGMISMSEAGSLEDRLRNEVIKAIAMRNEQEGSAPAP
jgi:hypothetical protein